ncbi:enoyl-CoA hydratase/isomerase family protein [Afipia massiliensis]|uniref:Enoyl-CoA hydratase/isomerase family protein n=1 Tax=Afipia massiliensis TaxID=211460 RepID=A0A4U6BJB0_9BRAD|nr:enoyl-CoA hydratase-related protein [Afipia massiliensis]TKT70209.1 enoyl-CoA hydratase/isomerase family protein [Afipia massiliensis]
MSSFGTRCRFEADFKGQRTASTSCSANFTRLGFHPGFGLTVTLPELVGATRASMLMLTGSRIKGDEAYRIGLCDVLATQESLRDEAMKLAQEIAESSPLGVKSTRKTLRRGLIERLEEQLKR